MGSSVNLKSKIITITKNSGLIIDVQMDRRIKKIYLYNYHMIRAMQKCVFEHMRTAKAQISLRIRAVWSGPSLSSNRIIWHCRMYWWRANAWRRLCPCMGWIWICAFCTCLKTLFHMVRPIIMLNIQTDMLVQNSIDPD